MTAVASSADAPAVPRSRSRAGIVAGVLAAIAIPVVILGLAVLPFLTPLWIYPGQVRADADAWTGWPIETVHRVTGEILLDLVVGPPDFDQTVDEEAVFTDRERGHLRDVRAALLTFAGVVCGGIAVLALALLVGRGTHGARRGIQVGARILAVAVIALAAVAFVAFDAAFEAFHQLLFPPGSYAFDPESARLVQLFPESFWFETAIAVGGVIVGLGLLVSWWAGRTRPSTDRA